MITILVFEYFLQRTPLRYAQNRTTFNVRFQNKYTEDQNPFQKIEYNTKRCSKDAVERKSVCDCSFN